MNKDTHLIFEAYTQRLEEMAIRADYTKVRDAIIDGLIARTDKSYIFDKIANAMGFNVREIPTVGSDVPEERQKEENEKLLAAHKEKVGKVVDEVVKPVIDALFPGGICDVDGEDKAQLNSLKGRIENELSRKYPAAFSGYTARIIKNFIEKTVEIIADNVEQGDTLSDAKTEVEDALTDVANKSQDEVEHEVGSKDPGQAVSSTEHGTKSTKHDPVERAVYDAAEDGIAIDALAEKAYRVILNSGKEDVTPGQVKKAIMDLVAKHVLVRKGPTGTPNPTGNFIYIGDLADEYEKGEDLSDVDKTPTEIANRLSRQLPSGGTTTRTIGDDESPMSRYFG
jgi:polyhydroxyalkanoate synthesis regulator phasin